MFHQRRFRVMSCSGAAMLFALTFHSNAFATAGCDLMAGLDLPNTTITLAQSVEAGKSTNLPAYCRVTATLKPSMDSDIHIEVWMPETGWNGKYLAAGNGGWGGSIVTGDLATGLRRGYATSSTDTGHTGGGAFALGHPEKVIDFGYRAIHETTLKSKAIITAFYGSGPTFSYWNSCSAGGRQGLDEAQRYPTDFDGIIAGAPAVNWTGRAIQSIWVAQAMHNDEASYIPPTKYPALHAAALQACDELDRVKDGVIENPRICKFDPKVLECRNGDAASCLTTPQVEASRKVYSAVNDPRTGREIFPGQEPGSEANWANLGGPTPLGIALDEMKYVVFNDANWDYKSFHFDRDIEKVDRADAGIINALNPNLGPFFARKGKIIQYHGWADQQISPMSSVNYYTSVYQTLGGTGKTFSS
ncbi:MAG TPA: tannase/feruloyl esterase family alpha/beta hydrolase, partial [Terriglobia bacterium]|nr:tannase/feruloyl esterase family alpha/beta hydrolase [Terriglobia bacterium]